MVSRPVRIRKDWRRQRSTSRPGARSAWSGIFLDELGTEAVLLPRIVALGDIDEDELAFAEDGEPFGGTAPLDIRQGSANSTAG